MSNLTQQDAEDAILEGRARAEQFMQKFVKRWEAGGKRRALARVWSTMPTRFKDQLQQQKPDQYKTVTDYLSKP